MVYAFTGYLLKFSALTEHHFFLRIYKLNRLQYTTYLSKFDLNFFQTLSPCSDKGLDCKSGNDYYDRHYWFSIPKNDVKQHVQHRIGCNRQP